MPSDDLTMNNVEDMWWSVYPITAPGSCNNTVLVSDIYSSDIVCIYFTHKVYSYSMASCTTPLFASNNGPN